jgi:hypothetical protein
MAPNSVTLDIRVLGIPEVMQMQREHGELLATLKSILAMDDVIDTDDRIEAAKALIARTEKP